MRTHRRCRHHGDRRRRHLLHSSVHGATISTRQSMACSTTWRSGTVLVNCRRFSVTSAAESSIRNVTSKDIQNKCTNCDSLGRDSLAFQYELADKTQTLCTLLRSVYRRSNTRLLAHQMITAFTRRGLPCFAVAQGQRRNYLAIPF